MPLLKSFELWWKPFLTDTNTLYFGSRHNAASPDTAIKMGLPMQ